MLDIIAVNNCKLIEENILTAKNHQVDIEILVPIVKAKEEEEKEESAKEEYFQ